MTDNLPLLGVQVLLLVVTFIFVAALVCCFVGSCILSCIFPHVVEHRTSTEVKVGFLVISYTYLVLTLIELYLEYG